MSRAEDKKSIKTTIASYTSWIQNNIKFPDESNTITSINSKNEIIPYLLDLLKVVVGSSALKQATGELFTNFTDTIEPIAKEAIKKQITQPNSDTLLPTNFTTSGVIIPITSIDTKQKFKVSSTSTAFDLLYGNNINSFDYAINNAITNEGTDVTFNDVITINYDSTNDSVRVKPINTLITIGEFLIIFVESLIIINKSELISDVMNILFGTITKETNKNINQTKDEVEVNKIIEQVINNSENEFTININDLTQIEEASINMTNGVLYDNMGCGMLSSVLSIEDLKDLIDIVSVSTDPFIVANAFDSIIDKTSTNNPETTTENRETIKDSFFQKIIKAFSTVLCESVTISPQIRTLLAVSSSFQNNGIPEITIPKEDFNSFRIFIKCVIGDITKKINEFVFNMITTNLNAMLQPVIKKLLKERANQYAAIIKSLIKF